MRLIDVPNGSIFRLHDDFVLKTEYFSRVDDVYIPDCYIIGTGEKFCGGMKTKDDFKTKFNDLEVEVINVLSDVSNTSSVVISQPEPHWIPVSERVPEDYVDVLVWFEYFRYGNYNRMYATHGIGNYSKEYNSWAINHETGWKDLHVFAWMPLPEPYGKGGKDGKGGATE